MKILVNVSLGELVDKITILRIKSKKIREEGKALLIRDELGALEKSLNELELDKVMIEGFLKDLEEVNTQLWEIEDAIREKERCKEFDAEFIELARKVYLTNDNRFLIKNNCNETFGSRFKEVKSYQKYT